MGIEQDVLDEPVLQEDGGRLVGKADAVEIGLGQAVGDVARVGWNIAVDPSTGALVDLVGHDAFEQEMALAAEFENLGVGERRLAVKGALAWVVVHGRLCGSVVMR